MIEQQYLPFLSSVLTPSRLEHSLGVMQTMSELAGVYRLDAEKAQTIGILHDAGKDLPPETWQPLLQEGHIRIQHEAELDYNLYLHGPVTAYFVQRELGITDEQILGAISTHCYYGDDPYFDDPLSWCMRFSDLLEPTRDWSSEPFLLDCVEHLREIAFAGKMWESALILSDALPRWHRVKGFSTHPNYFEIQRRMAAKIN